MPHLMGCVICDKPATVIKNDVYYCSSCALKEQDKTKEEK